MANKPSEKRGRGVTAQIYSHLKDNQTLNLFLFFSAFSFVTASADNRQVYTLNVDHNHIEGLVLEIDFNFGSLYDTFLKFYVLKA